MDTLSKNPNDFLMSYMYSDFPRTSLVAQMVKHLPTMRDTQVPSLGWEDPLKKGTAIHFIILAWGIPWNVSFSAVQSLSCVRLFATS